MSQLRKLLDNRYSGLRKVFLGFDVVNQKKMDPTREKAIEDSMSFVKSGISPGHHQLFLIDRTIVGRRRDRNTLCSLGWGRSRREKSAYSILGGPAGSAKTCRQKNALTRQMGLGHELPGVGRLTIFESRRSQLFRSTIAWGLVQMAEIQTGSYLGKWSQDLGRIPFLDLARQPLGVCGPGLAFGSGKSFLSYSHV